MEDRVRELTVYLAALVRVVQRVLAKRLVGVYAMGSIAYGGFQPGESDIDAAVVIEGALDQRSRTRLIGELDHRALACPARRLELVVYARELLATPSRPIRSELNLNTGRDVGLQTTTDPSAEPPHWFVLDLAIGREHSEALVGPPLSSVLGEIPPSWQLEAIVESLQWHRSHEPKSRSTVLNSCRSWRYVETEEWGSKIDGARWVQTHRPAWASVARAAETRAHRLEADAVLGLVEAVLAAARAALSPNRVAETANNGT